jgi:hypothetical protein
VLRSHGTRRPAPPLARRPRLGRDALAARRLRQGSASARTVQWRVSHQARLDETTQPHVELVLGIPSTKCFSSGPPSASNRSDSPTTRSRSSPRSTSERAAARQVGRCDEFGGAINRPLYGPPRELNRWRSGYRPSLATILLFLGIAAVVVLFVAGFASLFASRYPSGRSACRRCDPLVQPRGRLCRGPGH